MAVAHFCFVRPKATPDMNGVFEAVIVGYCLFMTIFLTAVKSYLLSQGCPGLLPWLFTLRDSNYLDDLISKESGRSRRTRLKWLRFTVYAAFGFFPVLLGILDLLLP
jgi:hypothetical protein